MTPINVSNFHVEYMDVLCHWHPGSASHAGGDALITALHDGWAMGDQVTEEIHWYAGMRQVTIYHFKLTRGDKTMIMPVVNNPYVTRMIKQSEMDIVSREKSDSGITTK